ncbi:MAG TPA: VWA domain-containing protein [Candidatus Dormibacteraeota bacterium]|nr:VWA domain-containing protein [Candidatus Dormibacteraeota bacterium]
MVHAVVLDASNGKVLSQADWYLHDSRRYVWPLGGGRILLRRLNSLFVIDADLRETPLWTSPKDLLWVSVTPDGQQIITETMDDASSQPGASKTKLALKARVQIEFRDTDSMAVQRVIHSDKPANVEALSSGVASVIAGFSGKVWLVRFGPSEQQRTNVARVRTRRIPDVLYLSSNTLLIGRDSSSGSAYSVSAFTVTGNRLWRQRWTAHRYDPTLARSEDGSRFAISTLTLVDAPQTSYDEENPSQPEGLEQRIEVFDTASGTHVISATASPIVLQGRNYALSPDGLRFAVLRGTQVEVDDLPSMTPEEQARYSAVKADVPGLYIRPADHADSDTGNPVFTTAAAETEGEKKEPAASDSSPDSTGALASSTSAVASLKQAPNISPVAGDPALPDSTMTFKTSTQVVALDVVVTDSSGNTVRNVPRQDFVVREDGKPQPVTYFDEVKDRAASPPVAQPNEVAPNIFTNRSPAPEAESVTLILYDLLNTPADQQQRAKLELLKFLQSKPKESRFALCALSDSLQMIQGFTPDEGLLIRAAKGQKGSLRYTSLQNQDAQDQLTISWLTQGSTKLQARDSRFAASARGMLDAAGRMEQEASLRRGRDLDMRAWLTMDAFAQLARYLSAIPGRKSLIWLSGSFPLGIFPGVDLRNSDATSSSYTEQVKQAVNLLAESHIAVYPVDVRGLTAYSLLTPSFSNAPDSTQPSAASQSPYSPSSETMRLRELGNLSGVGDIGSNLPGGDSPFMQEMTEHGIMDRIAADTGGKAFYNTNGIEQAMAVAMEQERNYYALSYTPTNKKYDGKFRKVKVSLAGDEKKLHLIHRSGYYAVDATSGGAKDAAKGFGLAAMQHGSPQAHQIVFEARVAPIGKLRKVDPKTTTLLPVPVKGRHGKEDSRPAAPVEVQRYLVDYAITPSQLRFDATPEGIHHGITNFMITSFDEDGTLRTSVVSRAVSDLKPGGYQEILSGGLRFRQQLDIPVQATSMRLGVQDGATGRMGTMEIPLPVKALPGVESTLAQRMPEIEPD